MGLTFTDSGQKYLSRAF